MVSTKNRGGTKLHKGFTVLTNDRYKARVRLQVLGEVKAYMTVSPKYVRFFGLVDQPLKETIEITPSKDHPFSILAVKVQEGAHLRYNLKPLGPNSKSTGYTLVVENTLHTAGSYRDVITIETDSKEKPSFTIPVYARIQNPPEQRKLKTD